MTYTNRRSFAVMLRKVRQAGTIVRYVRDWRLGRTAVLRDGTELVYVPAWRAL